MKQVLTLLLLFLLQFVCAQLASHSLAQEAAPKTLPLAGEVFTISDRTAFLIPGKLDAAKKAKPWVWYAPTLPNLPGPEERWMFERFQSAGIGVAGMDVGESFGSPQGNARFNALYDEMQRRGFSAKPVLLGRSRGGLMMLSWAAANPGKVAAFAGIYPVCNLASYPGVAKAAGAFKLTPSELETRLAEFNPVDRLANLAKAGVPLFAIHGDVDQVVPLEANSLLLKNRYIELGGKMDLSIPPGQGHNMWRGFFECAELVTFVKAHAGLEILLESPQELQVIQRNAAGFGAIPIRGALGKPSDATDVCDTIEVKLVSKTPLAHPAEHVGEWQKLDAQITSSVFQGSLRAPAGGWYQLQLRTKAKDKVLSETTIERVGVGEIFVVAGQSNSANHGQVKQQTKTGRVVNFDGQSWRLANDPQPGASGEGGSFVPLLGDAIAEKFDIPVAFLTCGVGATSVREWLPKGTTFPNPPTLEGNVTKLASGEWASTGEIYNRFVARMKQLGPNGFRAVLWHQGESDANQADASRTLTQHQYRTYLQKLIVDSQSELGWRPPWFIAQATYHIPGDEASPEIRAAQASLWEEKLALQGPDTDALKGPLRENNGQGVHFSAAGLREHAALWFAKLSPWLDTPSEEKPNEK